MKVVILFIVLCLYSFSLYAKEYNIEFKFHYDNAKKVSIAGDFNDWSKVSMISLGNGDFILKMMLPIGEYNYKYIVDDKKWVVDNSKPSKLDGEFKNNYIFVGTKNDFDDLKKLSSKLKTYKDIPNLKPPYRFAVCGDNRDNPKIYKKIIMNIKNKDPKFLIQLGDYVSKPTRLYQWEDFIKTNLELNIPEVFIRGNHDAKTIAQEKFYGEMFGFKNGELYCSFNTERSRFITLDSYQYNKHCKIENKQLNWLKSQLSSKDYLNGFVFLHHPFYPAKGINHYGQCMDKYTLQSAKILEMFSKNNIKIVFAGHQHVYFRTKDGLGITHIVTGGSGAPLYKNTSKQGVAMFHYIIVDVLNSGILCTVYRYNNDGTFNEYEKFNL